MFVAVINYILARKRLFLVFPVGKKKQIQGLLSHPWSSRPGTGDWLACRMSSMCLLFPEMHCSPQRSHKAALFPLAHTPVLLTVR